MRAVAALLVLALAVPGCADRPRTNPFDPGNPSTQGRPTGFLAIGENDHVTLHWDLAIVGGPVGYQLYRRGPGEPSFTPLGGVLPGGQLAYVDVTARSGSRYDYQLYYVLSGSRTGLPAQDYAIPGPRRVWYADLTYGSLNRLSSDSHRLAFTSTGFFGPTQCAFDSVHRRVWVSDTYAGQVASLDPDGVSRLRIGGLTEPVAIEIDAARDRMWVCDQARDAVFQFRLDGTVRAPTTLSGIDTPISVAHDPQDGSIWVCERGGNRVRRYSGSGTPAGAIDVIAPSRVAVDSLTQDAWVTSFEGGAVYRITNAATIRDTIPLFGPIGVGVDARRGRIWVADAVGGSVLAFHRSGALEFRVDGLPRVRELAIELATGECYATVPGSRSVVRISPAGAQLGGISGLGEPYGIVIEP